MELSTNIKLKKSKYNIVISGLAENTYCIYNTLQDSITLTKPGQLDTNDISILHKQGVLVNSNVDERLIIRHRNNYQKYSGHRLHLFLTVTGVCNCNCQYCFAKDSFPNKSITPDDVSYIINFIASEIAIHPINKINIDFFGGEPFTCFDLCIDIMRRVTKLGVEHGIVPDFQFYTNGTIRPREGYLSLKDFQNVKLLITLDGIRDVHDLLRPLKSGNSCFERIISNLKSIKKEGIQAVIRINFGKLNYATIPELLDYLIAEGLDCFPVEFYPIQNMSCGSADYTDAISADELPELNRFLFDAAKQRKIKLNIRPVSACCYCSSFTNTMFVIDPDLNIYKCALLQCNKKYSVGNLKKSTAYQRDSTFYDWITYDPSLEPGCKDCVALPVCSGGCGGSGTFRFGTHHHSNCYELSPKMLTMRIKHYVEEKYRDAIASFCASGHNIMVLEHSRNSLP